MLFYKALLKHILLVGSYIPEIRAYITDYVVSMGEELLVLYFLGNSQRRSANYQFSS